MKHLKIPILMLVVRLVLMLSLRLADTTATNDHQHQQQQQQKMSEVANNNYNNNNSPHALRHQEHRQHHHNVQQQQQRQQRLQHAADDFKKERDKITQHPSQHQHQQEHHQLLPQLVPHLRHEQHSLRQQNKRELAWEQQLATELRHHQHKSPSPASSSPSPPPLEHHVNLWKWDSEANNRYFDRNAFDNVQKEEDSNKNGNEDTDETASSDNDDNVDWSDDIDGRRRRHLDGQHKSTVKRNLAATASSGNNYNYDVIVDGGGGGGGGGGGATTDAVPIGFSVAQWRKIEETHRRNKMEHERQLLAMHKQQRNSVRDNDDVSSVGNTKKATSTNYDNYNIGRLTRQKNEQLGTPEAVLKERRRHAQQEAQDHALAQAHLNQMLKEATCRVPQRRCERIQRDPSKTYSPHCTVLHRCSEDSGCCPGRTQICAPKRTKNVVLHFLVTQVSSNSQRRKTITEKLTFVNHTECHCIERDHLSNGGDDDDVNSIAVIQRATILSCTCPKLFEKILQEDGNCRCDCSSSNFGCTLLKRGSEHFSLNDRKCIQQGRCKPPTCEYGAYLERFGRCAKQHEQISTNGMGGS